ncbi:MAG: tetratricopeptide repeat protein [Cyanobacteria bacterium P01_D01_bin.36]
MPNAELFTELINLVDVDPFALLGISVSADEKRIAKRYRQVAKQLHPDALSSSQASEGITPDLAAQIIARIVNPAYQKLKHEKTRSETLTLLRLRVRRLVRTEKLVPTFSDARQLESIAEESVEVFYEQAMSKLAAVQFRSIGDLQTYCLEIGQLNLVYLRRKMADLVIRPKRTGLLTNAVTPTRATTGSISAVAAARHGNNRPLSEPLSGPLGTTPNVEIEAEPDYVAKHTSRAKTYLSQKNYEMAVQELRDAIKLSPQSPEIHSMLGQAYYKQKMSGMAKAHFRQALKLKPNHKVAQKYGKLLGLSDEPKTQNVTPEEAPPSTAPTPQNDKPKSKRAWLGKLLNR